MSQKVTVIGAGRVGLVTAVCLASRLRKKNSYSNCHVTVIDQDPQKISDLQNGRAPFFEPGLATLLKKAVRSKNLSATTEWTTLNTSDFIFITIGTLNSKTGRTDASDLDQLIETLVQRVTTRTIVVLKSTIPFDRVQVYKSKIKNFIYNPEFLSEGHAISDFTKPERVVIGSEDTKLSQKLKKLYGQILPAKTPYFLTSVETAVLAKYGANAMLAQRISLINELARVSEKTNADILQVQDILKSDSRIGTSYLSSGIGFGGSCFHKDLTELNKATTKWNISTPLLKNILPSNQEQLSLFIQKITSFTQGLSLAHKDLPVAIWGLSFKKDTDDLRNSPAIEVVNSLLKSGHRLHIYDPVSGPDFQNDLPESSNVQIFSNKISCLKNTSFLVILTDWDEFKSSSFEKISSQLVTKAVFDGRNLFQTNSRHYHSVGRA